MQRCSANREAGLAGRSRSCLPVPPMRSSQQPGHKLKKQVVERTIEELEKWRPNGRYINHTSAAARPMLKAYWKNLKVYPTDAELATKAYHLTHPWSGAFISYVMHAAGAGEFFEYHPRHMHYVHAAKKNVIDHNLDNPFWLRDIATAIPEPGDIVCMTRRGGRDFTYDTVQPTGGSHCDIVISVDRQAKTMQVVGGNNNGTAREYSIPLNDNGTVNTRVRTEMKKYAIIKLRTDKCSTW
jgi:hypothetical protein